MDEDILLLVLPPEAAVVDGPSCSVMCAGRHGSVPGPYPGNKKPCSFTPSRAARRVKGRGGEWGSVMPSPISQLLAC